MSVSQGFREYLSGRQPVLVAAPRVPGLSEVEEAALRRLMEQLRARSARNALRRRYYAHDVELKSLGMAMPPAFDRLEAVLGWPAKAVDSMVRRTVLDRWQTPSAGDADTIGLSEVLEGARLDSELPGALTASLIHGVAFGFVSAGDVSAGEPRALVTVQSAEHATATWDARRRAISEALAVTGWDESGWPTEVTLYLPGVVTVMRRDGQKWGVARLPVPDGDVPVEPVAYRPLLARQFGHSRITRPVMSLTDQAVRVLARTEVGAEFFNTPQRYALGASPEAFDGQPGWKILLGHLVTLERDADGNMPQVGQFPQQSMQPNVEHFRMVAQAFAAETSLPLRSLGVVGDNPESADAISEANREIELEIRGWQRTSLTPAFRRLMGRALHIQNAGEAGNLSGREWASQVAPHWQRPDTISLAAAADAVTKLDAVAPGFGASQVGLEMAGLEPEQIAGFRSEQARLRGRATLERLNGAQPR